MDSDMAKNPLIGVKGSGQPSSAFAFVRTTITRLRRCRQTQMLANVFNNARLYYFHTWFVLFFVILSICFFFNSYISQVIITATSTGATGTKLGSILHYPRHRSSAAVNVLPGTMCNLPNLDPFDKSILEFLEPAPDIYCTTSTYPKLFRTNFNNKLIRMVKINGNCCYKSMQRTMHSDLITKFSKTCTPITRQVTVIPTSIEFLQVQCEIYNETSAAAKFAKIPVRGRLLRLNNVTSNSNNNVTRYIDMFAFVPPKEPSSTVVPPSAPTAPKANTDSDDQLNIVILGLDGQSHMNFIRQMPLTTNYLKNLSMSETNIVIEMNGYTKVGDNTFPNVIPLLTGLSVAELVTNCWGTEYTHFDLCPFIWKNFSAAGYRTSYAEDSVWMGIFQYEKLGFYQQPTDYYLNPFILQLSSKLGHEVEGNSKLCYGPRLAFEVLLDYLVKTFVRFSLEQKGSKFFQFIWTNSLFHDYLNHPKIGDELLYMTLEWLTTRGYLNNTLFIVGSDHGIRWGGIRNTYQGRLEERLPMLYFILPKWFETKYMIAVQNLRINRNRLTTPFDIHEMLVDLFNVDKNLDNEDLIRNGEQDYSRFNSRGLSLFRKIPTSRTCSDAGVDAHWCTCFRMTPISSSSHIVKQAARFVVRKVNQLISNHTKNQSGNACAKLRLAKITSAMRKVDEEGEKLFVIHTRKTLNRTRTKNEDHGDNYDVEIGEGEPPASSAAYGSTIDIELQLTISVQPSEAILEATAYMNQLTNYKWEVSGEISRLNLYGDQSSCVTDPVLQKYCYCANYMNNIKLDETNETAEDDEKDKKMLDWYENDSKPLKVSL